MEMGVGAFTEYLIILFVAPGGIPQTMGGVEMFFSGEVKRWHCLKAAKLLRFFDFFKHKSIGQGISHQTIAHGINHPIPRDYEIESGRFIESRF